MATIDLLQANSYIVRNNDVSQAITNGFINHNGDLQMIWGYEKIVPSGWVATKPLLATLVTSDKRYIVIADIEGIVIWKIDAKNRLHVYTGKLFFSTHRWVEGGKDKYGNGIQYRANPAGISMIQNDNGIIYITDGSIGGLYLLTLTDDNPIYFKQLDYALITPTPQTGYIPPYQNGKVVEMVSPVALEFYNPNIIVIDNRYDLPNFDTVLHGYLYVLQKIGIGNDGVPTYKGATDTDNAIMTQRYKMSKPIISAKLLNNILYVISFDRIEMYRLSSGILPIEKIQSNALEMGCYGRHLLTTFNGKLIFVGQNDNKIPVLCVWKGGERDPSEFNKNNLSYIFTQNGVNMDNLTLSTFATSAQEFVIINRLPVNLSVLVDITENSTHIQDSYFIKEVSGFNADYIFQIGDTYYYLAFDSPYLFLFSENITTFQDKTITVELRTMQYASNDGTKLSTLSNLSILLQSLPEDFLSRPTNFIPYLEEETRFTYTIQYRSRKGWLYLYDGRHLVLNPETLSANLLHVIQVDKRTQLKITFYPKLYKYNKQYYYSPIIVKQINIDADSY